MDFTGFVAVYIQGKENESQSENKSVSSRLSVPCEEADVKRDRVLTAFTAWDLDGDGYLSWEEFQRISNNTVMSQEQAMRIFQHCDKVEEDMLSLIEIISCVRLAEGRYHWRSSGKQ